MQLEWWRSLILNQTVVLKESEPEEKASDLAFTLTQSGRCTVFTVHSWVGSALGFPPKEPGRLFTSSSDTLLDSNYLALSKWKILDGWMDG